MIDGRSTYSKVIHLHDILTQDYTLNDSIPYTEIEYKITSTFGYSDKRSYEKFFKLLEQRFFIIKASNAHPIAKRKTVTKQKSNGGDISFQFFRGNPYCWSHYRLGSTPLKPRSPRAPLQSSINEWGVEKEEHMLENICVRVDAEGVTAAPSLDANIRDVSVLSSPEFDVGERNVDRREKRE